MKNYRKFFGILLTGMIVWGSCGSIEAQPYATQLLQHEQQIDNIISGMTLEEKIDMLHGKNMFSSAGIPRLGIADIEYADGPFGIREEMEPHSWNSAHLTTDSATFFPTGSALAATWSTEWAYAYGKGMSREARLRGKDMICHQYPAYPYGWTNLRVSQRGSLAQWCLGSGLYTGCSGGWYGGMSETLCLEQPGGLPWFCRCAYLGSCHARDLPATLRDGST